MKITENDEPKGFLGRHIAGNGVFARTLVVLIIINGFLALEFTENAVVLARSPAQSDRFVYENLGVGCLIAMIFLGLLLVGLQKGVYWPLWSKKDRAKADERQLVVRQRIFEKAYRMLLVLTLIITLLAADIGQSRINHVIGWIIGTGYFILPAIIAAGQKDS